MLLSQFCNFCNFVLLKSLHISALQNWERLHKSDKGRTNGKRTISSLQDTLTRHTFRHLTHKTYHLQTQHLYTFHFIHRTTAPLEIAFALLTLQKNVRLLVLNNYYIWPTLCQRSYNFQRNFHYNIFDVTSSTYSSIQPDT